MRKYWEGFLDLTVSEFFIIVCVIGGFVGVGSVFIHLLIKG